MQEKIGGLIVRFFNQFDMPGFFTILKLILRMLQHRKHVPVCALNFL